MWQITIYVHKTSCIGPGYDEVKNSLAVSGYNYTHFHLQLWNSHIKCSLRAVVQYQNALSKYLDLALWELVLNLNEFLCRNHIEKWLFTFQIPFKMESFWICNSFANSHSSYYLFLPTSIDANVLEDIIHIHSWNFTQL